MTELKTLEDLEYIDDPRDDGSEIVNSDELREEIKK